MKILPLPKSPKVGSKLIWPRSSTIYHIIWDGKASKYILYGYPEKDEPKFNCGSYTHEQIKNALNSGGWRKNDDKSPLVVREHFG